jgi:hypothetical protein
MTEIRNHSGELLGTMRKNLFDRIGVSWRGDKHIAPLVVFRMAFGAILLISTLRFVAKGWVYDFYIAPHFYFPFWGFEWIKPLPAIFMYLVFAGMALASFFILIGFLYRLSITVFFLCFVYTELIDKTYYLNHYYFVSIISFLMLLVPAHRYFSVDASRRPSIRVTRVPAWTIDIFKGQLCLIYFLAGLSKLNPDWMGKAMPLKIWLPANAGLPLIGPLLTHEWVAFAFSWFGALFDLSIGFLLLYGPTRRIAYLFVIVFHVFTGWLFKIGMFPYIMIATTVIFFSEGFHKRLIQQLRFFLQALRRLVPAGPDPKPGLDPYSSRGPGPEPEKQVTLRYSSRKSVLLTGVLGLYIFLQLVLPFRYLLYPGTLCWTEEGYRFSWRVMLMEKGGTAFFYITDPRTGNRGEVNNSKFLTPLQEKMMETQPDMMLQYAHYLSDVYTSKGIRNPVVTVESYVTLNGSGSRLFIDSTVDLSKQKDNFLPKKWILPFHSK